MAEERGIWEQSQQLETTLLQLELLQGPKLLSRFHKNAAPHSALAFSHMHCETEN